MSAHRRISLAFGALYLITFVTSISALWLFQPVLDDPQGYIAGGGADSRIYLGALLELILIIANIGTAIVLITLLKRQHEILTFSYVAARIMECVFILVGILAALAVVTLRHDAGADPAHSAATPNRSPRSRTGRSSWGLAGLSASGTGSSWAT